MRARDNPFRAECILRVAYRLRDATWPELMERFDALGRRCALVGPEGSGKTTLLEEFERRLAADGVRARMVRIDNTGNRAPLDAACAEAAPDEVVLIDGADVLGRLAWRRAERELRRTAGLLVTAHRPYLLPTFHTCSTWPELLDEIVEELAPTQAAELLSRARPLYDLHDGNLRCVLRDLYEVCAAMNA